MQPKTSQSRSASIKALFVEACDLPAEQREAFLGGQCADSGIRAEVDCLLAAHDAATAFLCDPSRGKASQASPGPGQVLPCPMEQIGPYKLVSQIGEGGFGIVYIAEQESPIRRRVALKVLKHGMDTRQIIARFAAERQALAMMEHPNIAKVFDAGATQTGRPYFVMELVDGVPLTQYCDENRLSMKARLDLFALICHAVQHAHQKGIIHRDLKPSNILVTMQDGKPSPKIIDFGIAKATQGDLTAQTTITELKQMVGTPQYMSPEQTLSGGDVDTRTDIYSLGVILYELLTGTTPFDVRELRSKAYAEVQRVIREVDPPLPSIRLCTMGDALTSVAAQRGIEPSRLRSATRGEPDWIVMKCIEKDRVRRYDTVTSLAEDIGRFLRDEPVLAGPPSASYRLRKFAVRHRAAIAAAAVILFSLVTGLGLASAGFLSATREGKAARAAEQREGRLRLTEAAAKDAALEAQIQTQGVLADSFIAHGLTVAESDPGLALLLYVKALTIAPSNPAREWEDRLRIALALRAAPRLLDTGEPSIVPPQYSSLPGKNILFDYQDGRTEIRVVVRETGQLVAPPITVPGRANVPDVSRDGRRMLVGTNLGLGDSQVFPVDIATGAMPDPPILSSEASPFGLFTPDGNGCVVFEQQPKRLVMYDLKTGLPKGPECPLPDYIERAAFSPDGKQLAVSTAAPFLPNLLCLNSGSLAIVWQARVYGLANGLIAFSPDSRQLLATGIATARLFNAADGRPLVPPIVHTRTVEHAGFSEDGARILTNDGKNDFVWSASRDTFAGRKLPHDGVVVQCACFSPDGKRAYTGDVSGQLRIWNIPACTLVGKPIHLAGPIQFLHISQDGGVLVAQTDDSAHIFDAATGKPQGHPLRCHGSALSPDGRLLVICDDQAIRVHRVSDGATLATFSTAGRATQPRFSPDGKLFLTLHRYENAIHLWDAGQLCQTSVVIAGPFLRKVHLVEFSPTGRQIVGANFAGFQVWEVATGRRVSPEATHEQSTIVARFDPTGTRVVSGDLNRFARIWDARDGRPLVPPMHHPYPVNHARFSGDGRLVITRSVGPFAIWSALTGKAILPPQITPEVMAVADPALAADGSRLLVPCDGFAQLIDLKPDDRAAADLLLLAEVLSCRRIDETGAAVPLTRDEWAGRWTVARSKLKGSFEPPLTDLSGGLEKR